MGLGGGGEGADFAAGGHVVGFDEGAEWHFGDESRDREGVMGARGSGEGGGGV